MKINKKQNRMKLADIIEFRLTDKQFDMGTYAEETNCGTVGCALGWAALSGEIEGLGWAGSRHNIFPVVEGKEVYWWQAGQQFFGTRTFDRVFINNRLIDSNSRKKVASALSAIK